VGTGGQDKREIVESVGGVFAGQREAVLQAGAGKAGCGCELIGRAINVRQRKQRLLARVE
jgi:hypothetical protein